MTIPHAASHAASPVAAAAASPVAALPTAPVSKPWWHYGHVWMVLGGPAVVVVAGIVTAVIAINGADPVIDADYSRHGREINQRLQHPDKSLAPAQTLRNHAATPDADLPSLKP